MRSIRTTLGPVLLTLAVAAGISPALGSSGATTATPASTTCHRWAANHGDDAAAGTEAAPVRTLGALVRRLTPGQTGCLRGGATYDATGGAGIVDGGGHSDAPITIRTGGAGRATLVGWIHAKPTAHDIVFTDLTFAGTPLDAAGNPISPKSTHVNIDGDRITLERVEVRNPYGTCIDIGDIDPYQSASEGDPSHDIRIVDSQIHQCGTSPKVVLTDRDSGTHAIYLVNTRNARIVGNRIHDARMRGLQFWPNAKATLVEHNVFARNSTHVNVGSALREGAPWASSGNVVRGNVFGPRTQGIFPVKNPAAFVGNFPLDAHDHGNVIEGNCVHPDQGTMSAGAGFRFGANRVLDPGFVNEAAGDLRLRADSPCRDLGPASLRPAATVTRSLEPGTGTCAAGRVDVTTPAAAKDPDGRYVYWRVDLYRWDGARWVATGRGTGWQYGWAGQAGLHQFRTGQHWVDHATGTTTAAGGALRIDGLGDAYVAAVETTWFAGDADTTRRWMPLAPTVWCRTA